MAWRNRMKGRSQGFRKIGSGRDDVDEVPLLVRPSSLSPKTNYSAGQMSLACFNRSPSSNGSNDMNTNIAAVSDDFEALAFPENKEIESGRTTNNSSPVSIVEHSEFGAQFNPGVIAILDEKEDSAVATVFDDDTSNDESVFLAENQNDEDEIQSLRPPSITVEDKQEGKPEKDAEVTSRTASNSIDKSSKSKSKKSGPDSNTRLSSSTRNRSSYNDEDADAATWAADEIDKFVGANDFGSMSMQPAVEVSGIDLLTDRDRAVNELQEVSHLMTFNALVLIQKQKDWIEGSLDATKNANKGSSNLITMELQNLERKIKILMDNKSWQNETERKKQEKIPFTPSRAFFKSMSLIDKSIEQFHKGYLKHIAKTSEENHELKTSIEKLIEVNASLQEEVKRSRQKTITIRKLQKECEDITRTLDCTEQILSSLLINAGPEFSVSKESSKIYHVKSYIQKLENERNAHLEEIQSLKRSFQNNPELFTESNEEQADTITNVCLEKKDNVDSSLPVLPSDIVENSPVNQETGILGNDLASKWNIMEQNEAEMTSKDEQIKSLTKTVDGQESALESVRAECKLMRLQLLQLETTRNEFKSQCERKESALAISQDRISSLEEEVLKSHAKCATYEEDYEAMKESFETQKIATKEKINSSQDEVKAELEQIREEFKEKLEKKGEQLEEVQQESERAVRDLRTHVKEIEGERDNLKAMLARNKVIPMLQSSIENFVEEEKKECDDLAPPAVVSPTSSTNFGFDEMRDRFVEKASKQAFTIAQLTEENETKDEQLKALQEMVEMLLGKRNGEGEGKRQWGQRLSNLRAKSRQSASNLVHRSQHGSKHGTWHGNLHGSQHGEFVN